MAEAAHPICKLLILSGICVMSYKIYNLTNEATTLMLEADKNVEKFDRTYDAFTTDYIIDTYREWREKQTLLDTIASTRRFSVAGDGMGCLVFMAMFRPVFIRLWFV
ncbi:Hypothetical predicted protein [Prunus dulcis]|uniref:Uncharacterized protein n=1 Tax=Prunus dulcis TaxID=3755 RepID=A0A5E4FU06_PRUDU|nr:Hypothetical predicted protein [Prunus dulcis]